MASKMDYAHDTLELLQIRVFLWWRLGVGTIDWNASQIMPMCVAVQYIMTEPYHVSDTSKLSQFLRTF